MTTTTQENRQSSRWSREQKIITGLLVLILLLLGGFAYDLYSALHRKPVEAQDVAIVVPMCWGKATWCFDHRAVPTTKQVAALGVTESVFDHEDDAQLYVDLLNAAPLEPDTKTVYKTRTVTKTVKIPADTSNLEGQIQGYRKTVAEREAMIKRLREELDAASKVATTVYVTEDNRLGCKPDTGAFIISDKEFDEVRVSFLDQKASHKDSPTGKTFFPCLVPGAKLNFDLLLDGKSVMKRASVKIEVREGKKLVRTVAVSKGDLTQDGAQVAVVRLID